MTLTKEQRAEIEQRESKATPGPLNVRSEANNRETRFFLQDPELDVICRFYFMNNAAREYRQQVMANVDFYLHARTDIPALLEALRDAEEQLAEADKWDIINALAEKNAAESERDQARAQMEQVSSLWTSVHNWFVGGMKYATDPVKLAAYHIDEFPMLQGIRSQMTLEAYAQAHAERLRQEGREEERARIGNNLDTRFRAYMASTTSPEYKIIASQVCVHFAAALHDMGIPILPQQPTGAAGGGADA